MEQGRHDPNTPLPPPPVEGYEHLPPPPVEPIPVDEGRTAMDGLRDFLSGAVSGARDRFDDWRLKRAEARVDELETHDHVIKRAAGDALVVRGFGSTPESPDVTPISRVQRIAARHRERQAAKIRHAQRETYTITQNHGEKGPVVHAYDVTPRHSERTYSSRDAARWNKGLDKQIEKDRAEVPVFDTRPRMKPAHRRAVLRQSQEHSELQHHREHTEERLERGERGETTPGRVRAARISRAQRKRDRLAARQNVGRDIPQELRDLLGE